MDRDPRPPAGRRRVRRSELAAVTLAAVVATACCGSKARPQGPAVAAEGDGGGGGGGGEVEVVGLGGGADTDAPPLEERIAAIERAMNDLAPVANQCWAAAAADELAVAGAVRMLVTIDRDGTATAEAIADEPGKPVLIRCLREVLAAYAWAPPIRGQVVELPFAFTAPPMQNVIDRRLVPRHAQAGVSVAVLLDQLNSANAAISLLEVAIDPGVTRAPRGLERTELWIFRSPARVGWVGMTGKALVVERGDAVWAPKGALLQVEGVATVPGGPPAAVTEAVIAIVPGGREGSARAGALPGVSVGSPPGGRTFPQPVLLEAAAGARWPRPGGAATIRLEPGSPRKDIGKDLALLGLELEAGAVVPAHIHAAETEVIYLLGGGGTMTIGGVLVPVTEHSVIQIPAGVEHAFTASAATVAIQLYTPAGPEQRFKKPAR